MFKKIRVVILLSILLFVALGEFLAARRSTSWDDTLWVDVYLVNGDRLDSTQRYIDSIDAKEFAGVDEFFAAEAKRYGVAIDQPFRLNVIGQYRDELPTPPVPPSVLGTIVWSLELRWIALKLDWQSSGPRPDICTSAGATYRTRQMRVETGLPGRPNTACPLGPDPKYMGMPGRCATWRKISLTPSLSSTFGTRSNFPLDTPPLRINTSCSRR